MLADRRLELGLVHKQVVVVVGLLLSFVQQRCPRGRERLGEEALGAHKVAHVVVCLGEPERVVGIACPSAELANAHSPVQSRILLAQNAAVSYRWCVMASARQMRIESIMVHDSLSSISSSSSSSSSSVWPLTGRNTSLSRDRERVLRGSLPGTSDGPAGERTSTARTRGDSWPCRPMLPCSAVVRAVTLRRVGVPMLMSERSPSMGPRLKDWERVDGPALPGACRRRIWMCWGVTCDDCNGGVWAGMVESEWRNVEDVGLLLWLQSLGALVPSCCLHVVDTAGPP